MRQAIDVLNELLKADPRAVTELMSYRVAVSKGVVDHPDVVVQTDRTDPEDAGGKLGVLGLINGILERIGGTRAAMQIDEAGRIVGFCTHENPMENLARFAEKELAHDPWSAKPFELTIIEECREMIRRDALRLKGIGEALVLLDGMSDPKAVKARASLQGCNMKRLEVTEEDERWARDVAAAANKGLTSGGEG